MSNGRIERHRAGVLLVLLVAAAGAAQTGPGDSPAVPDPALLAWRPEETPTRLEAAQQLCAAGEYDTAHRVLETGLDAARDALQARALRERERVAGALALRERVVTDLLAGRGEVEIELADVATRVRITGRSGNILQVRTAAATRSAPIAALRPEVLLQHAWRRRWLTGPDLWLDRWLRWLAGTPIARLAPMLSGSGPGLDTLRADLTASFAPGTTGDVAGIVDDLQRSPPAEGQEAAWRRLNELRSGLKAHGRHPLLRNRYAGIAAVVRSLAERGVSLQDPACLALGGRGEALADGRVRIVYDGKSETVPFDLVADHAYLPRLPRLPVPLTGSVAPAVTPIARGGTFVGAGLFRWPLPLRGRQVIEFDQSQPENGFLEVMLCDDRDGSYVLADVFGISIVDRARRQQDIRESASWTYFPDRTYRVRIEHDGKEVVVSVDGTRVAGRGELGTRLVGAVGFHVHSDHPISVHWLAIEGEIDPSALPALRAQTVANVLRPLAPEGR